MRVTAASVLRNPLSALGVAVTTATAVLFIALFVAHAFGFLQNPYLGILVFIIIPAVFVVGLLMIPLGLWLERRREAAGAPARRWPTIDLNEATQARMAIFVVAMTFVNVIILSMAGVGAVEYSDSTAFCGQVCHTVMRPEFVAHEAAPHARIECAACHVGPGAGGFLTAKLNGTRQLWLVASGGYPRPIPTPVANLPSVELTCEQCHRPDRFIGDKVDVIYDHANDAANKESKTTVQLHVGGPVAGTGSGVGIHWHMNRANHIEYVALDDKREQIAYVRMTTADGRVREFFADGANQADLRTRPRRVMDCLDCHNRAAHTFGASAAREVDAAMGQGLISAKIPFIRREAVRALNGTYTTQDEGIAAIDREIRKGVNAQQPHAYEEADLRRAIAVAQQIYRTNIFPEMKVGWGTYPNQLGHTVSNGCFRCHDDSHKASDGAAISQDCELCHTVE
jgi:mono/diheme cytochrome c family protein